MTPKHNLDDYIAADSATSDSDALILKYAKIFLDVSKQLQHLHIPDEQRDKLLQHTCKQLSIIYGYFVEFDPASKHLKYFLVDNKAGQSQYNSDFEAPYISYLGFEKEAAKNYKLYRSIIKDSRVTFDSFAESPKIYQHLPVHSGSEAGTINYISDYYLNNFIPYKVKSENDYYVVLYDEIAFFQFAYKYLSGESTDALFRDDPSFFLTYLVKFALSVETAHSLKSSTSNKLHKFLGIEELASKWKTIDEAVVRNKVETVVTLHNDNLSWRGEVLNTIGSIVDNMITAYKNNNIQFQTSGTSDIDILKHLSRFEIQASFLIINDDDLIIPHDLFIFPIYTETEIVDTTEHIDPGQRLNIHSPILLVLYLKTLHKINGVFDETISSVEGFQMTKEIVKLFARQIIQEDYLKNVIRKELLSPSTKAAISQVMARNMSHNIGSHVMNKLLSVEEITFSVQSNNYLSQPDAGRKNHGVGHEDETVERVLIFNAYLKARMDYLADVTFGRPVMQTNKNLYADIFTEFDRNKLLLNNISALGANFKYTIIFTFEGVPLDSSNDIKIAVPNDLLGCQAFYNVLENIIRNTAKHGKNKPDLVKFFVNVSSFEKDHSLYRVEVYDNLVPEDAVEDGAASGGNRVLKFDQEKNSPISETAPIDRIVFNQNLKINQSILVRETNMLRPNALGLIEIETSCAYLRKIDINDIESDDYELAYDDSVQNKKSGKLNILKAIKKDGCLGYQFFVLRPTEILIVGLFSPEVEQRKAELLREGIWLRSIEEFIHSGEVFNHQFLLYNDEETAHAISLGFTRLPTRCIKMDKELEQQVLSILLKEKEVLRHLDATIWQRWNELLFKKHRITKLEIESSYPEDNNNPEVFNAVLLNHAANWNETAALYESYNNKDNNNFPKAHCHYLEALPSNAMKKLPGFKTSINDLLDDLDRDRRESLTNRFKLNESFLTRILVIDERVQSAARKVYSSDGVSISFYELYKCSNIVLPVTMSQDGTIEMTIDLSAGNFDTGVVRAIKNYIAENCATCDFLLLHYSILERMFSSDKVLIDEYLELCSEEIKVVLTSGRGKPANLPDFVNFVNLTPVLDAFIENRSKYAINYLLNSSRIEQ